MTQSPTPALAPAALADLPLIDVAAAARAGQTWQGQTPLLAFARLLDLAQAPNPDAQVQWRAAFEQRSGPDGRAQPWLTLQLGAQVVQTCQRCLSPVTLTLQVEPVFRFVANEATAEREDDASDEDLLVISKRFDLAELIEDELLLALPLVALHEHCAQPLAQPAGPAADPLETPHPFAALNKLRGSL